MNTIKGLMQKSVENTFKQEGTPQTTTEAPKQASNFD